MSWVLWVLGLAMIVIVALAATGALGQLDPEDDFDPELLRDAQVPYVDRKIPTSLFGYRKDVVDALLEEADRHRENARNTDQS